MLSLIFCHELKMTAHSPSVDMHSPSLVSVLNESSVFEQIKSEWFNDLLQKTLFSCIPNDAPYSYPLSCVVYEFYKVICNSTSVLLPRSSAESCNRWGHDDSIIPHFLFNFILLIKCTFSFWKLQCNHIIHTKNSISNQIGIHLFSSWINLWFWMDQFAEWFIDVSMEPAKTGRRKKSTSLIHKQTVSLEHANKHKRSVINNENVSVLLY